MEELDRTHLPDLVARLEKSDRKLLLWCLARHLSRCKFNELRVASIEVVADGGLVALLSNRRARMDRLVLAFTRDEML